MRDHLASLIDDFRLFGRDIAVVRYQGNRRRATTYPELARLAGRFAAWLAAQQIVAGDRVLLWAENSAEWIAAFYGCLLRGVLAVPLDAAGSAEFAARVAADVNPRLAIGDALLLDKLTAAHTGAAIPTLAFEDWIDRLPNAEMGPISGLSRDTPLEILFTSGTTGDPKGVVITHGNVLASVGPIEDGARPYMKYERLIHPLRILHTLPLSHVFGQTMGLWVPPIFKAELHFESRLAAPRLIELIHTERISVAATVPRVLALLKSHLESTHAGLAQRTAASRKLNPWLRWWRFRAVHREFGLKFWAFVSGGGALPGPLEQFWNALGFVLVQGYGMTETTGDQEGGCKSASQRVSKPASRRGRKSAGQRTAAGFRDFGARAIPIPLSRVAVVQAIPVVSRCVFRGDSAAAGLVPGCAPRGRSGKAAAPRPAALRGQSCHRVRRRADSIRAPAALAPASGYCHVGRDA
jgi:long-chain acyl-CoA synthetase